MRESYRAWPALTIGDVRRQPTAGHFPATDFSDMGRIGSFGPLLPFAFQMNIALQHFQSGTW